MSPTQPFAQEQHPTAPVRRAFSTMLNAGRALLSRIQAAIALTDTTRLPTRFARAPLAAEQRIARTLDWIVALSRTLAGDTAWLITPTYIFPRFPGRYPSLTAQLRREIGLPPIPPRTEAQKAAAHRRYVKKIFATLPVARIAARLARRLDIPPSANAWPTALLTLTQTPAAYAKSISLPPASPSWEESGRAATTTATPRPPDAPQPRATDPP